MLIWFFTIKLNINIFLNKFEALTQTPFYLQNLDFANPPTYNNKVEI